MLHVIPQFKEAHILRREMLVALSDYAILGSQMCYEGYGDGILFGCHLTTTESEIVLNPGMVCFEGRTYLIKERLKTRYYPTNQTNMCKLLFSKEVEIGSQTNRELEIAVTKEGEKHDGGIELCRFKLQQGAMLRYDYVDFDDRCTEYDTLNTIYAPYAAKGGSTLSLPILQAFARQMMELPKITDFDAMFCILVQNQDRAMAKDSIVSYIKHQQKAEAEQDSNLSLYKHLALILLNAEHGMRSTASTQKKNQWKIMID